jgi:hypothetical protein
MRDIVVSGDAMQTQRGLSQPIIAAGGDYLFPVKDSSFYQYLAYSVANSSIIANPVFASMKSMEADGIVRPMCGLLFVSG